MQKRIAGICNRHPTIKTAATLSVDRGFCFNACKTTAITRITI